MAQVTELYHYPVKGLSAQKTGRLSMTRAGGLAYDRAYALALGSTLFDPAHPEPLEKGHFLMLRANESLAALQTYLDPETEILQVRQDGADVLTADLSTPEGREATEDFFSRYAGAAARGRIRLTRAERHSFTDISVVSPAMMRAVSVINLATVRSLENALGEAVHPLRFRANIYIDGVDAGAELDWVGKTVRIGAMTFRGALRTKRCAAVDVNPVTARRDMRLPKALMRHFGHPDLGIYLEVLTDGEMAVGDRITV